MRVTDRPVSVWREVLKARPPLMHALELLGCPDLRLSLEARPVVEGLLEPIAPSADVFRNHASRRFPTSMDVARVYAVSTPTAVLAGCSAIHIAGAMPCGQVDKVELSVLPSTQAHSLPQHAGVDISTHTARWRSILEINGVLKKATVAGGALRTMTPGAALAELLIFNPDRSPEPDMIDFDAIDDVDLHRMRRLVGLPYTGHIKDVYAEARHRQLLSAAIRRHHARLRS